MPAFTPFVIVSVIQVVAIATGADALVQVTKPLLMPALAIAVVLARLGRRFTLPTGLLLLAIGLSWLGDLALMVPGDLWFVVGLGSFLLAHVAYLVLFLRVGGLGRPRAWSIVYAVWFVVFLAVLIPGLGSLVVPVVLYGLVLGSMATAATRVSGWVAAGAAVFVVSDTILALSRFLPGLVIPAHDTLTMLTYCVGQGVIAAGVLAVLARTSTASAMSAPGAPDSPDLSGARPA
ncbi:lysoplasmalogenase [Diaminobutyricibacter sp. McL0608]|uniref:lysoplasmalogenase n=1 Tax=Leifsonia sp. McL0608 TaxID=3143537 RepID=UPI0031F2DD01